MNELTGRVTDASRDGQAQEATILVGARQHRVALPGEERLQAGDLVTVALVEDGARVRLVHARPGEAWDANGDGTRWRRPGQAPSRMELLYRRQAVVRALRDELYAEGFLEVTAPLVVAGACPDVHLDAMRVGERYLTTSTEYQIKRLVVGGFDKVFTLTQNFRAGEEGDQHNPEFTMLEWARAFGSLDDIERDAERMVKRAFAVACPGSETLRFGGREVRMNEAFERLTVAEARRAARGVRARPGAVASRRGRARRGRGAQRMAEDEPALVSYLIDAVQPKLGAPVPVFLCDWPSQMTSGATGERSELVIAGVELSDGFPSIRDPELQERLFLREEERRGREGKAAVMRDTRYVEALRQGLAPGAGMAMGVDRLVMVLTGAERIEQVLAFGWGEL